MNTIAYIHNGPMGYTIAYYITLHCTHNPQSAHRAYELALHKTQTSPNAVIGNTMGGNHVLAQKNKKKKEH